MTSRAALSPGEMLLHYRLLELIGEAGMGQVWKAFDTSLERHVALKVLPAALTHDSDRLNRFEREARLLAALNHPNVAIIHGLHQAGTVRFLAMELVSGEDLSQRLKQGALPLAAALKLGVQLAAALEVAHARGIVHRDLKPANIRIMPSGSIKVLDFGIAKELMLDTARNAATVLWEQNSTQIGDVLGTPAYMSPEQATGQTVDARCDVWAFACVLYESLTGVRVFAAGASNAASDALKATEPDWGTLPRTTPSTVRDLLRRCLTNVDRRLADIATARQTLEAALASISGASSEAAARTQESVAVLPLVNMSGDVENQYFSDGLAEDLINALTRLPALRVASRTSAFRFRGSNLDVRQIGGELNVSTVVEGSVRRSGNRVRVTAQLISPQGATTQNTGSI